MAKRKRRVDKKIHIKYIDEVFREVCQKYSWGRNLCSSQIGEEFNINTYSAIVLPEAAVRSIIIKYNLKYIVSKIKVSNKTAVIKIWPKSYDSVKRISLIKC